MSLYTARQLQKASSHPLWMARGQISISKCAVYSSWCGNSTRLVCHKNLRGSVSGYDSTLWKRQLIEFILQTHRRWRVTSPRKHQRGLNWKNLLRFRLDFPREPPMFLCQTGFQQISHCSFKSKLIRTFQWIIERGYALILLLVILHI